RGFTLNSRCAPLNGDSLQACRQVPESEPEERPLDPACERHQLAALAHLAGKEQGRRRLPVRGLLASFARRREARELAVDARVEQVMRLRRKAAGLQAD